jgi:flagellar hook protein FlgE
MSFNIALSGLNAASAELSATTNNIANSNTTGFKSSRAEFADVYAQAYQGISATATGNGVRLAQVQQQFSQGNLDYTNNSLDLAINGQGFFTVSNGGNLQYTRDGSFNVDNAGYVVTSQNARLQVYPATGESSFNTGGLSDLRLDNSGGLPKATSQIALNVNLQADATAPTTAFDANDPSSYSKATSTTVYDSLGTARTGTIYFAKDAATPNTWNSYLYVDGTQVGDVQPISFDGTGKLTSPAVGNLSFGTYTPPNGANALPLSVDLSASTQYGGSYSINSLSQDGYGSGQLSGIDVDKSGIIQARYTNGRSTALGKIALTNFANPQGLQKVGDTSWAETYASGASLRGEAGTGGLGLIQSGALEASNVDITQELVRLITAQRNFQANAQAISTENSITQTIINNIR